MSREREQFAVFGFDSTHDALQAENVLLAVDLDVVLIPTPRALGTLCGFSVRVPLAQREAALEALATADVDPNGAIETKDRIAR